MAERLSADPMTDEDLARVYLTAPPAVLRVYKALQGPCSSPNSSSISSSASTSGSLSIDGASSSTSASASAPVSASASDSIAPISTFSLTHHPIATSLGVNDEDDEDDEDDDENDVRGRDQFRPIPTSLGPELPLNVIDEFTFTYAMVSV